MRKRMLATVSTAAFTAGLVGGFSPLAFADQTTSGSGGVLSGNQVEVPVDVEAALCGNSLAALGLSKAQCTELSRVLYASSDKGREAAGQSTDGSGGVASGNQISIPVDAAVGVCGNSAAIGGLSKAECTKIVRTIADSSENGQSTRGSGGVASGNQISIPVSIAIGVCGNSIGLLGISKSDCTTVVDAIHTSPDNEGDSGQSTSGSGGVASGNQISVPVDAAVGVCGNAVSVLGLAEAECLEQISEDEEPTPEEPGDEKGEDPEEPGDPDKTDPGDEKGEDPEEPGEQDRKRGDEEPPAEADRKPAASGSLPVTGAALGGLVAAAVAALGGGGTAMYLSRKRKAAAAAERD